MSKSDLVLILDNIRSAHNVGSIWRTADAAGVERLVLVGITPSPTRPNDTRPSGEVTRVMRQITKTSLGAEKVVPFTHYPTLAEAISALRSEDYSIYALEQAPGSLDIFEAKVKPPLALILGHETEGVTHDLSLLDGVLEIPMRGNKESLNVSVAAGIAAYALLK